MIAAADEVTIRSPSFTADGIFDPPEILCRLEQERFITASDPSTAAYSRLAFAKVFPNKTLLFTLGLRAG
jgi:hypothetical protein